MILHSMTVQGFKSIGDKLEVEFPLNGRIAIIGHNESGKTTLLEALWFAIYGFQRGKGVDREDVITWGKEAATLKVKFIIGHDAFEIERHITRGGRHEAVLRWTSPEGVKVIDSVEAIGDAIEQVSGMDRKSFAQLVYVRQKELDILKGLAKADRELMINKVMGIDVFDRAVVKLKEGAKALRDNLSVIQRELENLELSKNTHAAKIRRRNQINDIEYANLLAKKSEVKSRLDEAEKLLSNERSLRGFQADGALFDSKTRELALLRNNLRLFNSLLAGTIAGAVAFVILATMNWLWILGTPLFLIAAAYAYTKSKRTESAISVLRNQLKSIQMPPVSGAGQEEVSEQRLAVLDRQYKSILSEFNKIDGDIRALDGELASIAGDIERLGNVDDDYNRQSLQVDGLKSKLQVLDRAELELRQTAVQIRKQVFPHARLVINRILPQITGSHYVDMQITEDFHFKTYSTEANDYKDSMVFSGGTQDQFLIALRLAFTQTILESRVRASHYALFMDECISSSDTFRRQGIFEMLDAMRDVFPQIFIIAHEDISEFVEHHLILSKDTDSFTKIRKMSWTT